MVRLNSRPSVHPPPESGQKASVCAHPLPLAVSPPIFRAPSRPPPRPPPRLPRPPHMPRARRLAHARRAPRPPRHIASPHRLTTSSHHIASPHRLATSSHPRHTDHHTHRPPPPPFQTPPAPQVWFILGFLFFTVPHEAGAPHKLAVGLSAPAAFAFGCDTMLRRAGFGPGLQVCV
jgi:hypothetical protein